MPKINGQSFKKTTTHSDMPFFRTSTANLFEPLQSFEQEKIDFTIRNSQNHIPYFSKQRPTDFRVEDAERVSPQAMQRIKILFPRTPQQPNQREKEPAETTIASPIIKKANPATPKQFSKIQTILKQAVDGHKIIKDKLKALKTQAQEKPKLQIKPVAGAKSEKRWNLSLTPSPRHNTRPEPLTPRTPRSSRYVISGSMTERYNKRQAELAQLIAESRLNQAQREMKQCTFHPKFAARAVTSRILAERNNQNRLDKDLRKSEQTQGAESEPLSKRTTFDFTKQPPFQFGMLKQMIKFELKNIPLETEVESVKVEKGKGKKGRGSR